MVWIMCLRFVFFLAATSIPISVFAENIKPEEIVARPKHGFAVPLGPWFRGGLNSFVRDLLLSETSIRRGIFNPGYLDRLIEWHSSGRPLDFQIWTLISFELWNRRFLDGPPPRRVGERASEHALLEARRRSRDEVRLA